MANIKKNKIKEKIIEFIIEQQEQGQFTDVENPEKVADKLIAKIFYSN